MVARVKLNRVERARSNKVTQQASTRSDRASRAIQCTHCGHWYIYPCVDPGAELDCANYKFIQSMLPKKRKKS